MVHNAENCKYLLSIDGVYGGSVELKWIIRLFSSNLSRMHYENNNIVNYDTGSILCHTLPIMVQRILTYYRTIHILWTHIMLKNIKDKYRKCKRSLKIVILDNNWTLRGLKRYKEVYNIIFKIRHNPIFCFPYKDNILFCWKLLTFYINLKFLYKHEI